MTSSSTGKTGPGLGRTHNGDTTFLARLSYDTLFNATLRFSRSVGGTETPVGQAIPLSLAQPPGSAQVAISTSGSWAWNARRLWVRPRVGVSPTGTFAYVALNLTKGGLSQVDPAFAVLCGTTQQGVDIFCRGGISSSASDGARVVRVNLATGVIIDTVVSEPRRNIQWLSVSEDGRELSYGVVDDSTTMTNDWGSAQGFSWRLLPSSYSAYTPYYILASMAPTLTNRTPCSVVFRSLTTVADSLVRPTPAGCRSDFPYFKAGGFGLKIATKNRILDFPPAAARPRR